MTTLSARNPATQAPRVFNQRRYQKRKLWNKVGLGFAIFAMGFGLFWLGWILWTLVSQGITGLIEMPIFTQDTPPPMSASGSRGGPIWRSREVDT